MVYNLFGRASRSADYAIHDEDVLEFIHRLVSRDVTPPEWLLSELRGRHLLILGVHLPDWLGRFVLRAATRDRLLLAQRSYFIAREGAATARTLDEFLRRFGRETHIQVCDAPVSEWNHLSLSEERPINASNIEMIQNRTIILGSAQPFFSKWW